LIRQGPERILRPHPHTWSDGMHITEINESYVLEYLGLVAVGATHEEAVAQIAQSNEVDVSKVEVECVSHWAA
jgi:hypothetical protein